LDEIPADKLPHESMAGVDPVERVIKWESAHKRRDFIDCFDQKGGRSAKRG